MLNNIARDDLIGGIVTFIVVAVLEYFSGLPIVLWAVGVAITAGLVMLGARRSRMASERGNVEKL